MNKTAYEYQHAADRLEVAAETGEGEAVREPRILELMREEIRRVTDPVTKNNLTYFLDRCLARHPTSAAAKDVERLTQVQGDLLAVIHGDGGQYRHKHGTLAATGDAIDVVVADRLRAETAEDKVADLTRQLAEERERVEDVRSAFMEAIDFAADVAGPEADDFVRSWREGGCEEIGDPQNEWSDFREWRDKRRTTRSQSNG